MQCQLIIIGCSLGGLNAMRVLLPGLAKDHDVPIVLIQHRDKSSGLSLSSALQRMTHLKVQDADDKTEIDNGRLYVAPAGYHLLVEERSFSLSTDLPVHYAMPSIDVAFESAARSFGSELMAIILTSSSSDGAEGAAIVESRGGCVIVQDPATAENGTLPRAALAATKAAKVARLDDIGPLVTKLLNTKGGVDARRTPR